MNPILAQMYQTDELVKQAALQATGTAAAEQTSEDDELNAAILDDLVKVAAANNFDLNQLTEAELVELVNEHKAELIKQASAEEGAAEAAGTTVSQEAMAEADLLGRTMMHAAFQEKALIEQAIGQQTKLASLSDEELFEELAFARAENVLALLQGSPENFVKEASLEVAPDMEQLDDAISLRAAEILEQNGYNLDEVADLLDDGQ